EGDTAQNLLVEGAAIYRGIGNLVYAPWCVEGLAGVAAALGEWDRAARLCGACDALRARLALALRPWVRNGTRRRALRGKSYQWMRCSSRNGGQHEQAMTSKAYLARRAGCSTRR